MRLTHGLYWPIFCILLTLSFKVSAQQESNSLLESYIEEGLLNNLALKQKNFEFEKSLQTVRQARSLMYPALSLEARYSVARGGRSEEIPVGDLVNPVYQSLNALLDAAENIPGPIDIPDTRFPEFVPNDEINFLRETDQETKLRLYQPVFQPEFIIRKRIADNFSELMASQRDVYERELVAQIKTAYYQYLIAIEVETVVEDALKLVDNHLENARKILKLKKSTSYPVYRIEAEKSKLEAELAEVEGNIAIAKAYFNFLLNRSLNEEIEVDANKNIDLLEIANIEDYLESAINKREEVNQLNLGISTAKEQRKLEVSRKWPTLSAVVDYGIQGEKYSFGADDDFFIGSLVFRWNIFSGLRQNARVQEAQVEIERRTVQKEEVTNQIRLEVMRQHNALKTSRKKMEAAQSEYEAASRGFDIVEALYRNEKSTLLEWLDGRNLLTRSSKSLVIRKYEHLIQWADFQRVIGM
ncbi:MAG: TolC family protein [Bacteroidota bacterium]